MTAPPHRSYRRGASEGVESGDCINAIKSFFKHHKIQAKNRDFFFQPLHNCRGWCYQTSSGQINGQLVRKAKEIFPPLTL